MEALLIPLILGVILLVIFLAVFFSRDAVIRRALRKAPVVRLGGMTDGREGRVIGKVRTLWEMTAPLSQRPCIHYRVKVRRRKKSGKSHRWVTLIDEHKTMDFEVDDGTGTATVQAGCMEVAVQKDAHYRSGTFNDAPPELEAFLKSRGHASTGWFGFNKTLKYTEGIIEEGETVAILGLAAWEDDPATGERRRVIKPGQGGTVLVSDSPDTTG